MTPIEHYREAERLLAGRNTTGYVDSTEQAIALAQVHATLANAHMTAGVWEQQT